MPLPLGLLCRQARCTGKPSGHGCAPVLRRAQQPSQPGPEAPATWHAVPGNAVTQCSGSRPEASRLPFDLIKAALPLRAPLLRQLAASTHAFSVASCSLRKLCCLRTSCLSLTKLLVSSTCPSAGDAYTFCKYAGCHYVWEIQAHAPASGVACISLVTLRLCQMLMRTTSCRTTSLTHQTSRLLRSFPRD